MEFTEHLELKMKSAFNPFPVCPSSFFCVYVGPGPILLVGFQMFNSLGISWLALLLFNDSASRAGLLTNLGGEDCWHRNSGLSIATSPGIKPRKQAYEQTSLRYSSPFSANKLIAFQTWRGGPSCFAKTMKNQLCQLFLLPYFALAFVSVLLH